ncbi:MAG TPA: protease pro-enzyme activation domain-containing protein, partial [Trebonia sp.]
MPELVPLPGSERTELPGVQPSGTLDANAVITVTLVLRRRAGVPAELITGPETITPAELGERYGASPADVELVTTALTGYELEVTESRPESRRLKVSGTVAQLSATFGTTLSQVASPHPDGSGMVTHRYRSGGLSVPAELNGVVEAVLGLDNRPQARAQFRIAQPTTAAPQTATPETSAPERRRWWRRLSPAPASAPAPAPAAPAAGQPASMTALQVAELYKFPANTDGTGQTIAIIELGGGYTASDLQAYFSGLGLSVPSVTPVPVDGGANTPGQQADGEVELDIEVAGAVAPKAVQRVYFAPNTDQGFIDAISDAVHATPTPTVVSISWGGPEDSWAV